LNVEGDCTQQPVLLNIGSSSKRLFWIERFGFQTQTSEGGHRTYAANQSIAGGNPEFIAKNGIK